MASFIRKILVPTDFSEASEQAVDYAARMASALGAAVYLVHVVDDDLGAYGTWDYFIPETTEIRARLAETARSSLAAATEQIEKRGLHVTTEVRHGSAAAEEIVTAALHYGVDLIVMATHGRSGLPHLLLGSVAERVIRHASCPVLAVTASALDHVGLTVHAATAGVA